MPCSAFAEEDRFRSTLPSRLYREQDTDLTDKETHFRNTTYSGWTNPKTGREAGSITFYKKD
jgi:hypothetical protein